MYSYNKLEQLLSQQNLSKSSLTRLLGISSRTIAKMNKGEKLSLGVLKKIAEYFECEVEELYRYEADNPLLQILRDEKEAKISGGIYHELQIRLTYNSNHIEGSRLNEDQTRMIFETDTVASKNGLPINDIIETVNHFRAIDYVIDHAEEPLTEKHIKELHKILKQNTKDSTLAWFNVGDYKKRPNMVGGRETVKPRLVPKKMEQLVTAYHNGAKKTVEDIIAFHAEFERIHPFQDGNGRVGRLIALKECLCYQIVPFIIEDEKKLFYYRGLSEWEHEKGYLIDTCLDGQDAFKKMLFIFEIAL